jgi:hypothetical protein
VSYKDKAEFFLVYIREAHPDIKQEGKEIGRPKDINERAILATKCVSELKLSIPALIDDMDGTVGSAYSGWPDRMCIVDLEGKVAYYGKRGPFGFKPDEGEKALKGLLGRGGRVTGQAVTEEDDAESGAKEVKKLKWSKMVEGLRGLATVNSSKIAVGESLTVNIKIHNLGYDPAYLYYIDVYKAAKLDIRAKNGDTVKAVRKVDYKLPAEDGRNFHLIEPGGMFETQIKGRLSKVSKKTDSKGQKKQFVLDFGDIEYPMGDSGKFEAAFVLEVDEQAAKLGEKMGKKPVWVGDLRLEIGSLELGDDRK